MAAHIHVRQLDDAADDIANQVRLVALGDDDLSFSKCLRCDSRPSSCSASSDAPRHIERWLMAHWSHFQQLPGEKTASFIASCLPFDLPNDTIVRLECQRMKSIKSAARSVRIDRRQCSRVVVRDNFRHKFKARPGGHDVLQEHSGAYRIRREFGWKITLCNGSRR